MNTKPDSSELDIVKWQAYKEELRLTRTKLLLSRNGRLIILWALLAAVSITALIVGDMSAAARLIGNLTLLGFLATLFMP